jgi:hypothetical protein
MQVRQQCADGYTQSYRQKVQRPDTQDSAQEKVAGVDRMGQVSFPHEQFCNEKGAQQKEKTDTVPSCPHYPAEVLEWGCVCDEHHEKGRQTK